jgi:hypothetical protein
MCVCACVCVYVRVRVRVWPHLGGGHDLKRHARPKRRSAARDRPRLARLLVLDQDHLCGVCVCATRHATRVGARGATQEEVPVCWAGTAAAEARAPLLTAPGPRSCPIAPLSYETHMRVGMCACETHMRVGMCACAHAAPWPPLHVPRTCRRRTARPPSYRGVQTPGKSKDGREQLR